MGRASPRRRVGDDFDRLLTQKEQRTTGSPGMLIGPHTPSRVFFLLHAARTGCDSSVPPPAAPAAGLARTCHCDATAIAQPDDEPGLPGAGGLRSTRCCAFAGRRALRWHILARCYYCASYGANYDELDQETFVELTHMHCIQASALPFRGIVCPLSSAGSICPRPTAELTSRPNSAALEIRHFDRKRRNVQILEHFSLLGDEPRAEAVAIRVFVTKKGANDRLAHRKVMTVARWLQESLPNHEVSLHHCPINQPKNTISRYLAIYRTQKH